MVCHVANVMPSPFLSFTSSPFPSPSPSFFPSHRLGRQAYDVNPRLGAREAVVICGHVCIVVAVIIIYVACFCSDFSLH